MQQQEWKAASGAYRAYRRTVKGIGMYAQARPLGISAERAVAEDAAVGAELAALPVTLAPAGFSRPAMPYRPADWRAVIRKIKDARAELARRDAEMAECEALGIESPRYIVSADTLRREADVRRYRVRSLDRPLDHLHNVEANLRVVHSYRDMVACELRASA